MILTEAAEMARSARGDAEMAERMRRAVEMAELLRGAVQMIVRHPDEVQVLMTQDGLTGAGVVLSIAVASDDVPRLLGRGGRMATALRTLVAAAGHVRALRTQLVFLGDHSVSNQEGGRAWRKA